MFFLKFQPISEVPIKNSQYLPNFLLSISNFLDKETDDRFKHQGSYNQSEPILKNFDCCIDFLT